MAWVVDTCLLIDLAIDDPKFCPASARLLDGKRNDFRQLFPALTILEP